MKRTTVLIVGGGGCGLALSIFLADAGVDFILVERNSETSILPKAHYLNPRTMEIFRQHGLADEVVKHGSPPYNRSRTKWYTSFGGQGALDRRTVHETGSLGGHGWARDKEYADASPTGSANLPQIRLEPLLRRHAEERAHARILFRHELLGFEQDAEGITASIRDIAANDTFSVRADFMIAADGGRTVGRALGIRMLGQRKLITTVSTHFEADLSKHYPDDRVMLNWLRSPYRPGVSAIVAMGPDHWGRHSPEWALGFGKQPGDPTVFDQDSVVPELRRILGIPDLAIKVKCVSEWTVEGVLAERYRQGRIFLVGDAAHRHPPTTGLGLNTGIQDAHNIAWKLALVAAGKAPMALLDSYEQERRPIGACNVEWALNAFFNHLLLESSILATHPDNLADMQSEAHVIGAYEALFADTANGRMRRARLATVFDSTRIELSAQDIEMGFRYDSGALVEDGTPSPPRDPLGQIYQPMARPGHRMPHLRLAQGAAALSSLDLVGNAAGFVLLTLAPDDLWRVAATKVAMQLGISVSAVSVGADGDLLDSEQRWAELTETEPGGAVLIRPDNMVAWRTKLPVADPSAKLLEVFRQLLGIDAFN